MPETRMGLTLENVVAFPVTLPNRGSSAGVARRLLRRALQGAIADPVLHDVELLVSELVANAVDYGAGTCCLELSIPRPDVLRVAVSDQNQNRPQMPEHDVAADSGRGLRLVHSLALRGGHHGRAGSGNTVWFEVSATAVR